MTDVEFDAPVPPEFAEAVVSGGTASCGADAPTTSTPLHRAAGRLRSALPPGWQVEVVDSPDPPTQAILRVEMPGAETPG